MEILRKQPALLELPDEILAFGDLHGDFKTLKRSDTIRDELGLPAVFLGDFVDRGRQQVETLNGLAERISGDPRSIFLVRGNHEDFDICSRYGFFDELRKHYNIDHVLPEISEFFRNLPMAARMKREAFFVHGGIPAVDHPYDIGKIVKGKNPIRKPELVQLVFNDPVESQRQVWSKNNAPKGFFSNSRGPSLYTFDEDAAKEFCEKNEIRYIVRAHVAIVDGYAKYNRYVYSVFSSSSGVYDRFRPGFALIRKGEEPELYRIKEYIKKKKNK